jgi:hypothetical protein
MLTSSTTLPLASMWIDGFGSPRTTVVDSQSMCRLTSIETLPPRPPVSIQAESRSRWRSIDGEPPSAFTYRSAVLMNASFSPVTLAVTSTFSDASESVSAPAQSQSESE